MVWFKMEETVDQALKQSQVTLLDKCELYSWQVSESDHVTEVSLKVDEDWQTFPCDAFISFEEKRVDFDAFKGFKNLRLFCEQLSQS